MVFRMYDLIQIVQKCRSINAFKRWCYFFKSIFKSGRSKLGQNAPPTPQIGKRAESGNSRGNF